MFTEWGFFLRYLLLLWQEGWKELRGCVRHGMTPLKKAEEKLRKDYVTFARLEKVSRDEK